MKEKENLNPAINSVQAASPSASPSAIPVLSVVGVSDSGKTTLLEKLIPLLRGKGLRLAIIKHDAHSFEMDHEGKDTWRFAKAGADVVAISSRAKTALMEYRDLDLNAVISRIKDVDIILTEGYKSWNKPKIMVHRRDSGKAPLSPFPTNLRAIIWDLPREEYPEDFILTGEPGSEGSGNAGSQGIGLPIFDLNDAEGLANQIFLWVKGGELLP